MCNGMDEDESVQCRWCKGWFPRWSMTITRKGIMCEKDYGAFEDQMEEAQEAAESRRNYGLAGCEDGS